MSDHNFSKLMFGQTVSQLGSQVSIVALPLTAAITLEVSTSQMGVLIAAEHAPVLLFGLVAGVVSDRWRCRHILLVTDLARALLLLGVPIFAAVGLLRIEVLYATAFLVGAFAVFFDVSYWAYLPTVVTRARLVEANSKLALTQSLAETVGPGCAGLLVQALTAPIAIIIDAGSFLVSAFSIWHIQVEEPRSAAKSGKGTPWSELWSGLRFVLSHDILRAITIRAALWNAIANMSVPLITLFSIRDLALDSWFVGMQFSAIGVGGLCGAALSNWIAVRLGVGVTIVWSAMLAAGVLCVIPVVQDSTPPSLALLLLMYFAIGAASAIYNVSNISLRQAIAPPELIGRVTATIRFLTWGVIPIAALAGGMLGEHLGERHALQGIATVGVILSVAGLLFSPLKSIAILPTAAVSGQIAGK